MLDNTNDSSRKIRIMRASSFLSRAQGSEVDEYYGSSSQNLGSFWESSNTRRIGSGLSVPEEQLLLPVLLSLPANDREFWQKRDEYFSGMEVKVPYKDGVELEIGLKNNSKELSEDNMPLNIHHYVKYRFAKAHPWCGASKEEAEGNQLKFFYIHDEVKATASVADLNEIKDEALAYYLAMKNDAGKVNMMLTLLGVDYRNIEGQTDAQTKQLRQEKLRALVNEVPADFKRHHDDKDFEVKYRIEMMVKTGIIKKVGAKYLITETGESLGTHEETVQFFKDEAENSDRIGVLIAKLQEATKAKRTVKRTK